jgi:hypothetical protein
MKFSPPVREAFLGRAAIMRRPMARPLGRGAATPFPIRAPTFREIPGHSGA